MDELELHRIHQLLERAAGADWASHELVEDRGKHRVAPRLASLRVEVALAEMGEVPIVEQIRTMPFARRIQKLEEYLSDPEAARIPESPSRERSELLEKAHKDQSLERADLKNLSLCGPALDGANLRRADLEGSHLEGASLRRANLANASLRDAFLPGANLEGANLQKADLEGAMLDGANLQNADLSGANLGAHGAGLFSSGNPVDCKHPVHPVVQMPLKENTDSDRINRILQDR